MKKRSMGAFSALCLCVPAFLQAEPALHWQAEVSTGISHQSALLVDELDVSSSQSDTALEVDASIALQTVFKEKTSVDLGVNLIESNYQHEDDFDSRTLLASAMLSHPLGDLEASLSAFLAQTDLDGERFFRLNQYQAGLAGFWGEKIYWQGSAEFSTKAFAADSTRDASRFGPVGSLYLLLNRMQEYVNIRLALFEEDADSDDFDYSAQQANIAWLKTYSLLSRTFKNRNYLKLEYRDYEQADRSDERLTLGSDIEWEIFKRQTLILRYQYSQNDSSISEFNYDQQTLEALYRWSF